MKNEIVRLQSICKINRKVPVIDQLSLRICEGEFHFILDTGESCNTVVGNLITGKVLHDSGSLFINGVFVKKLTSILAKIEGIYQLGDYSTLIPDMSISDNLVGLQNSNSLFSLYKQKVNIEISKEYLEKYGVSLHPNVKVKHLDKHSKFMVEIIKHRFSGLKLLVLNDSAFTFSNEENLKTFELLNRLKFEGVSIVILGQHIGDWIEEIDFIHILKHRSIIKTFKGNKFNFELFSKIIYNDVDYIRCDNQNGDDFLFSYKSKNRYSGDVKLNIRRSEVFTLLDTNKEVTRKIIDEIVGNSFHPETKMLLDRNTYFPGSEKEASEKGIERITFENPDNLLFDEMSLFDNLLFLIMADHPVSLTKIMNKRRRYFFETLLIDLFGYSKELLKTQVRLLPYPLKSKVIYQRMYLKRPKLLLCEKPFENVDDTTKKIIMMEIERFVEYGASVLLISSNDT